MSKQSNTLLGLITGVAVGGLLGVLFAPKAGKETREELSEQAKDLVEQAVKTKKELTNKLARVSEEEQEKIKAYIAQLDSYINNTLGSNTDNQDIKDDSKKTSA
jgi:gas vesicle protein